MMESMECILYHQLDRKMWLWLKCIEMRYSMYTPKLPLNGKFDDQSSIWGYYMFKQAHILFV